MAILGLVVFWLASSWPAAPVSADPPDGVRLEFRVLLLDGEAGKWVSALADPCWRTREDASRWLVAHPGEWLRSLGLRSPGSTSTANEQLDGGSAETRWRLERAARAICDLDELPGIAAAQPWDVFARRARRLYREFPGPFEGSLERLLRSPEARVRHRGVQLLALLPFESSRLLEWLAPLLRDPSPWVRATVYRQAAAIDVDWTAVALRGVLAEREPEALCTEVVRALRQIGRPVAAEWLRPLWAEASYDLKAEIALALCQFGDRPEAEVHMWMLGAGDPVVVLPALRAVRQTPQGDDLGPVCELLSSPYGEIRGAASALIEERGGVALAPWLVGFLASEDCEIVHRVIRWLSVWRAEDYYGELEAALARFPESERGVKLIAVDGQVRFEPCVEVEEAGATRHPTPRRGTRRN